MSARERPCAPAAVAHLLKLLYASLAVGGLSALRSLLSALSGGRRVVIISDLFAAGVACATYRDALPAEPAHSA